MKILVTGAAGFIGSHLCQQLVARGHSVVGVDCYDDFLYPADIKRANARVVQESASEASLRLVEADICDTDEMTKLCGDVETVCHLAARAGVRPSLRDPQAYVRTNLSGTVSMLEACRATEITRFVFASSSSVYGVRGDPGDPASVRAFREDDPCLRPASPYGATKRSGELICSTYRDLYGIGISALRFFTVYGPRQRPDMAIHKFARAISQGEPITMFGDGTSRRDYTYVDDIVAGTVAACERIKSSSFQIFNLGGTHTTSLRRLITTIGETIGTEPKIERAPDQPGDVPVTYADITESHRALGYQPSTSLPDGLAKFWQWYQAERPMP